MKPTIFLPEGSLLNTPENRAVLSSLQALERASMNGTVAEGIVTLCDGGMRLHVDLGCCEGIIEPEEAVFCRGGDVRKDIALITRVGKPVSFLVQSLEEREGGLIAILSRRAAQKRCAEQYLSGLLPGDIIGAKVTHMEPFGAFVDVGCGIPSLLSVDCISVSRIAHPKERMKCGEKLAVVVKSNDSESGRLYVSLRELLGTWEENVASFEVGQTVSGIIRSVESYGVFVELAPNLSGLAEVKTSEMEEMREHIGESVAVYIKSIIPERMKIKLVIIDSCHAKPQGGRLRYYVDAERVSHLSHWQYSPPGNRKVVGTCFDLPV